MGIRSKRLPEEDAGEIDSASSADSGSDSGPDSGSGSEESDDSSSNKRRRIAAGRLSPDNEALTALPFEREVNSRFLRKPAVTGSVTAPQKATEARTLAPVDAFTTFDSLNVRPWLVQSLSNMAIYRPTGIQKGCIPEILKGRDCIGGSRTGSGKTVAFAVPILQVWAEDPMATFALVLTPTRELALQILEQFKALSAPHSPKIILVTGGHDMRPQAIELSTRPDIVIATPGRLADHIRTSGEDTIKGLRRVRMVVLDEADRLLDASGPGSMMPDLETCLSVLPPSSQRQTLLFTATMTPEVMALKAMPPKPGKAPVFVCEVDTQVLAIPPSLHQTHLQVQVTHREHYLHMLLQTPQNAEKSAIIFCNRTATADYLHRLLRLLDHRVTALHSRLPQRQRTDNLGRFRARAARILVATDVASRGLDIPEVGLVVNYDVPRDPDDYVHRVGRTARAGRKGEAVTLVGQRDVDLVRAIEERVGRQLEAWQEDGVNLETRVNRDALKIVGEKKVEALLEIEEGREVGGVRSRKKKRQKLAAA